MNLRCYSANNTVFLSVFYKLVLYSSSGGTLADEGTILTASIFNDRTGEQLQFNGDCFSWSNSVSGKSLGTGRSISIIEDDFESDTLTVKCVFRHPDFGLQTTENISIDKEAGVSYDVEIISLNGISFRPNAYWENTLYAVVRKNGEDITDELDASLFLWQRKSSGTALQDEEWNQQNKLRGTKALFITNSDCIGRTTFTCSVKNDKEG